jgi:hypothetical protein
MRFLRLRINPEHQRPVFAVGARALVVDAATGASRNLSSAAGRESEHRVVP